MFAHILKVNLNHGPDGRFTSKPMTAKAKNKARRAKIVRAKDAYVEAANKETDAYLAHGRDSAKYRSAKKRKDAAMSKFLDTNPSNKDINDATHAEHAYSTEAGNKKSNYRPGIWHPNYGQPGKGKDAL